MRSRRADLAAAVAGILLGGFAGAGVMSAGGGEPVMACVEPGTGAVIAGGDCGPGAPLETGAAPVQAR